MPVSDLLVQGVQLMAIGMGIVFAFLLLLVGVLCLVCAVGKRCASDGGNTCKLNQKLSKMNDAKLRAVISAAIGQHRAGH